MDSPVIYYSLTLSPNPVKFIFKEDDSIELLKEHLSKIKIIKDVIEYCVPEFSDTFKLHYHMCIAIKTDEQFVKFWQSVPRLKRYGFIKILKTKHDIACLLKYVNKTWIRTKMVFKWTKYPDLFPKDLSYSKLNDLVNAKDKIKKELTSHITDLDQQIIEIEGIPDSEFTLP